ncbi:hypothetical protein EGW08_009939 [Elysia chlorotica]|uniref:C-type lectin domain-containing protein n=1 Tax=Elysia chlorotica TaxID=188477 RepID=A0A433TL32_ELYCH|nr:hypothetical protein EGW08_009939 [Elysia chlorotica]
MAFSWLHKSSRLLILHFLLCSFLPTASSQSVDPDPECTSDRKGLQACNFNKNKCLQEPSGQEAAWTHTPENGDGPFTPFEKHPTTCPPGYQQLDNHCFLLMPETMTFFEATVACDVVDGKLPEVVSPEDQTRLEKFLTSAGSGVSSNIWLGATDLQQEGTWRYLSTDNEDALSAWSHWAPSYPRVDRSSNCAVLNLPNGWRWQDSACSYNLQVMCEVTLSLDKLVG